MEFPALLGYLRANRAALRGPWLHAELQVPNFDCSLALRRLFDDLLGLLVCLEATHVVSMLASAHPIACSRSTYLLTQTDEGRWMTPEGLRRVVADVDTLGQPWALAGGLAVSIWAAPRSTHDIDIVVAVTNDAEAESIVQALLGCGWQIGDVVEQTYTERMATVRLAVEAGEGPLLVDVLFATSSTVPELAADAARLEVLPQLTAPAARPDALVAMKLLSVEAARPRDAIDLRAAWLHWKRTGAAPAS